MAPAITSVNGLTVNGDQVIPYEYDGPYEYDNEYDDRGRLIRKVENNIVIRLSYNDRVNKVSKVLKHALGNPDNVKITQYEYDASGNLVTAHNDIGERIHLNYNGKAQIIRAKVIKAESANSIVMIFTHNNLGQLETISVESLGTIKITYNATGEMQLSTPAGSLKSTVLQAFQIFRSLIQQVDGIRGSQWIQ